MNRRRVRAGALIVDAERVRRDVELTIADGRIESVDPVSDLDAAERATVVAPGFINAHVHLDLGALAGSVDARGSFLDWVGRLIELRDQLEPEALARGARAAADRLLRTGTTTAIDIDSMGVSRPALEGHGLRLVSLTELIDGSPEGTTPRTEAAWAAAQALLESPSSLQRATGWSPHGTHTVGDELLRRLGERRSSLAPGAWPPVAVHWAETLDEAHWLREGEGPFAAWLGPSPRLTGTERLERAGMLEAALLVHGNFPEVGEAERVARAGAAVVHCPGSHRFFGRAPFPLAEFDAAEVRVLLGTDSSASNDDLDMRREMRLAVETLGVEPARALRMATEGSARFVPWDDVTGTLAVGSSADLIVMEPGGSLESVASAQAVIDRFVLGSVPVADVVVRGVSVLR